MPLHPLTYTRAFAIARLLGYYSLQEKARLIRKRKDSLLIPVIIAAVEISAARAFFFFFLHPFYRIIESLSLERPIRSSSPTVSPHLPLLQTMSLSAIPTLFLKPSRDGDSTIFLGSLFNPSPLYPLPSKPTGTWEMLILSSPVWDSRNSDRWVLIEFLSSTHISTQPTAIQSNTSPEIVRNQDFQLLSIYPHSAFNTGCLGTN